MPDRPLYDAGPGSVLASGPENHRVRELLQRELDARVAVLRTTDVADVGGRGEERLYGAARGEFARDWCGVAQRAGLYVPGSEQRVRYPSSEEAMAAHVDAARTRLRQFMAGHNEFAYVLCGIETVIADRHGMAYPPCAYQVQGQLPV